MIKKKIQTVQCFGDLSFHPDILPAWTLPASNIKLGIFTLMVNHFNQYVISQHIWLHLGSENVLDQHVLQLTKVTKKMWSESCWQTFLANRSGISDVDEYCSWNSYGVAHLYPMCPAVFVPWHTGSWHLWEGFVTELSVNVGCKAVKIRTTTAQAVSHH